MQATNRVRYCFARQVSAATVATALSATLTLASAAEIDASKAAATMTSQASIVAIATGESVDGTPVYRLPAITVTASRRAELAKIKRERATADLQQTRTKIAAIQAKSGTPVSSRGLPRNAGSSVK